MNRHKCQQTMNCFDREIHHSKKPRLASSAAVPKRSIGLTDEEVDEKMNSLIKEMDLDKQSNARTKLLSPLAEGNTERSHTKHLNGLLSFCKLIGDVASMIILSKNVKTNVYPSVNSSTIANYAGYKYGNKDSILLDMDGEIVRDTNGNPILCEGSWSAPINYEQFLSSISQAHKYHGQEGPYQPACPNCYKTYIADKKKPDVHIIITTLFC